MTQVESWDVAQWFDDVAKTKEEGNEQDLLRLCALLTSDKEVDHFLAVMLNNFPDLLIDLEEKSGIDFPDIKNREETV